MTKEEPMTRERHAAIWKKMGDHQAKMLGLESEDGQDLGPKYDGITERDLDNMIAGLPICALRRGARFFMSPETWEQIYKQKDADGHYEMRRFLETASLILRGFPVVLIDKDDKQKPYEPLENPAYWITFLPRELCVERV